MWTDGKRAASIWGIIYDLPDAGRDAYLAWFHDVHMPEKLARPGYLWAAHYEVIDDEGGHVSSMHGAGSSDVGAGTAKSSGYIALFGGEDTQTFLDPSPAQIKPRQTPLTREMMAKRISQRSFIAAQEWLAPSGHENSMHGASHIALTWCDAPTQDEAFGAWCVQDLKPVLLAERGVLFLAKLLAATGPAKHVILSGGEAARRTIACKGGPDVVIPDGAAIQGRRIAP